jgi:hypothetical protein
MTTIVISLFDSKYFFVKKKSSKKLKLGIFQQQFKKVKIKSLYFILLKFSFLGSELKQSKMKQ